MPFDGFNISQPQARRNRGWKCWAANQSSNKCPRIKVSCEYGRRRADEKQQFRVLLGGCLTFLFSGFVVRSYAAPSWSLLLEVWTQLFSFTFWLQQAVFSSKFKERLQGFEIGLGNGRVGDYEQQVRVGATLGYVQLRFIVWSPYVVCHHVLLLVVSATPLPIKQTTPRHG